MTAPASAPAQAISGMAQGRAKDADAARPPAPGETRRPNGRLGNEHFEHLALRALPEAAAAGNDSHMKLNGLGLSFLARRLVTFDFPNHTLYLKRPGVRSLIF